MSSTLSEREKYCLALIISLGSKTSYDQIRDVILESRESFSDLKESYIKQAIKRVLQRLVEKKYLSTEPGKFGYYEKYIIDPLIEPGFIKTHYSMIPKAIQLVS